jgi:hypothetical protein
MENEPKPKSRFRWGRLLLILVMACLLMAIGYVGGNILHRKLTKKLNALDEVENKEENDIEDIEHEEIDDDGEPSELTAEEDEKASGLFADLIKDALPQKKETAKKPAVIGFRPAAGKTPKKK